MAVRWGLWGATTIAQEWVIGAIRAAGGEVVSLCGRDRARAEAYAAHNTIDQVFTDPAVFLGSGIDAVYISTINSFHHEQVLASAAAGKHILCEKPLALTLDAGREMIEACRAASVVFAVNHHLRNAAPHVAMKRMLLEGRIGDIVSLSITHAGYLPHHLQGWRINDMTAGSGVVLDLTVHDADLLTFLLDSEPESVFAIGSNSGMAVAGIEDSVNGTIRFRNGVTAAFFDAFTTPYAEHRLEVQGTRGSLMATGSLRQAPGGRLAVRDADGAQEVALNLTDLYQPNIRAFQNAIHGHGAPIATGEDGLRSLAVALAAKRSMETGAMVPVSR
ncbi:Gfo/Idh/MocA family protein [Ensifer soli]|uniref:Gfo/Idh/MocA family protein n=1 Tax=Ciceribacter sp. sgz301302 TaxID=3342379 RepID=UPI0035B92885